MADKLKDIWIPENAEIQNVHIIAGNGVSTELRAAERLAQEYGGQPDEWQKCVGKIVSGAREFDVHMYYHEAYGVKKEKAVRYKERG